MFIAVAMFDDTNCFLMYFDYTVNISFLCSLVLWGSKLSESKLKQNIAILWHIV
jgi:hypothetical protein